MNKILEHLIALYGSQVGRTAFDRIELLISNYQPRIPAPQVSGLTERDAILITYGDQVCSPDAPPLQTLADFCAQYLRNVISSIHLLPFFPYSSDDGFSVIDYKAVHPALGDWEDVTRFRRHFRLMFDAVLNHVSAQSEWFQSFLHDDPRCRDYFIVVPDGVDLSQVIRPRTLPLLTRFSTPSGTKNVWTTFSTDQIDLNYRNPAVLLEMVDTLLSYAARGAELIRLDAIAFLWKEFGTTCLNLPETHRVIQLVRTVLDEVAPHVILVTETNVPHVDNVSYFGDGTDEAHMVYNFALPLLTLHSFHSGNATTLSRWAGNLSLPSPRVTLFNFLASHDGIGLNPARGILADSEIDALVARTLAHAGLVSYKQNSDGTTSPYELNINYFDALSDPNADESLEMQVDRFIAAQAIMLSLVGVPGIYFHSLVGSRGWRDGVAATGQNRTINREKFDVGALEHELADLGSRRNKVFARYTQLLYVRSAHPAFDPYGAMRVLNANPSIFSVLRVASEGASVLCLHNVSSHLQTAELNLSQTLGGESRDLVDLISGHAYDGREAIRLAPYQMLWLTHRR